MKKYEAPQLFVDNFAADTTIAASTGKNGNPDNNQNCWSCNTYLMQQVGENYCLYYPGDSGSYDAYC